MSRIPHVIQLGRLRRQTDLDIAKAFARGQLGKSHEMKVFGAWQRPNPVIAIVASYDASEGGPCQTSHQLSKQGLADIHRVSHNNYLGE